MPKFDAVIFIMPQELTDLPEVIIRFSTRMSGAYFRLAEIRRNADELRQAGALYPQVIPYASLLRVLLEHCKNVKLVTF